MKSTSFKYLLGMGVKNIWVNKLMSIASVGTLIACMLIIGVAVMLSVNIDNTLSGIQDQNVIMAYLNDASSVQFGGVEPLVEWDEKTDEVPPEDAYLIHNKEEAEAVGLKIKELPNVKEWSYVSKEESLQLVKDKYLQGQEESAEVLDELNPLSDAIKVVVEDLSKYDETVTLVLGVTGVTNVQEQGDMASKINALDGAVKTAGIWIIAILALISLVIVSNTIKVTMYNRKLEISIMKAVGATNSFIRLPFIIEGVLLGLISSIIAFGIMYVMQNAVMQKISEAMTFSLTVVPFKSYAFILLGIFVAIGFVAGTFGSFVMMGKYLRKEGSEFRAL